MRRALIVGGGFGGVSTAYHLSQIAPETEITLVDQLGYFQVGFRKSWALVGHSPIDEGRRSLKTLERLGVHVLTGTVTKIDPAAKSAEIDGKLFQADALVVALGAELVPSAVPGFAQHAFNVYDAPDIPRAAQAISEIKNGRVLIGILGAPYKCPPAPYEMALLAQDSFRERKANVQVTIFTPQAMSLPILGQTGCSILESRLEGYGIKFLPNHKASGIESNRVNFAAGNSLEFDLMLGVPPHRVSPVVATSGLTEGSGWVKVNPRTLETKFPGVYAIGDINEIPLANKMPLPKAGVFAEAEGEIVAHQIADAFAGKSSHASFDGFGYCFLEVGGGMAQLVQGNFLAEPAPEVTLTEPSTDYLEHKREFEQERLQKWFGG